MKIAVDARPLSVPATGISRYCRELLLRLVNSPHEWFLYTDRPFIESFPHRPNVHIRHGSVNRRLFSTPFAQLMFPVWARKDQIELFWSPRHHLPVMLHSSIKKVVTVHDLVWVKHPETMTRFGSVLERCLMPWSVKVSSRVICPSSSTASDMVEKFNVAEQKLRVIHSAGAASNKIDCDCSLHIGKVKKPYMLFVGTMEPRKNLKRVLQAFSGLVLKKSEHQLYLVGGDGWGNENLEELILKLGISEKTSVLGRLSDQELWYLYANADILVMPSLYEGFGLPLVEAIEFHVPVITSNVSSMPEVAGDAGLLVDPLSVVEIQQAMERLCTDRALHQRLSENAKARAELFSWDISAQKTLDALESA